ncbi:metal ABC transporter ATP-binding protein [Acetobacter oeni]|uniref:ABC transporter ATP-binding protein n=1 Tax=Acetobacter oeni TaxID=304077 RepID=A0A511XM40_9PROT|nr:ATP-binding cassette domain-containing protein [Acetobacter oeni]MBB3884018.1 zinc/manganese transport system ATP-binding protein [Acetobacter oeni]NHO20076.1 ATP-binding cassette domain-containing protein [Acetobacter oeni]GBR03741.1 Mn2+/Zn2+ transporter ATP-binding protein [Acetobacter oeni LMG 21952]GEN64007.1 ABC transporter ATP-binding protein [Acetobacter oeni]
MECEAAVSCHDVTLAIGGRTVLSDVCLSVEAGSFVGLFGPNGAGKTTFLRALLGLVPVLSGEMTLFGASVTRGNRGVGYMPQSRTPNGGMLTGRDLLASGLSGEKWGLPRVSREGSAEVEAALEAVDAASLGGRRLGSLSGGERQRLLIAQTLLGSPRLLLLDEPLASLDPVRMREVALLLREVARKRGMTVICSAHDISPLMGVMDTVLCLVRGRARIGPVDEVVTGPVLSELYGAQVEVCHAPSGRVLVSADGL